MFQEKMFSNLYAPFEFMSLDVGLEFHDNHKLFRPIQYLCCNQSI